MSKNSVHNIGYFETKMVHHFFYSRVTVLRSIKGYEGECPIPEASMVIESQLYNS